MGTGIFDITDYMAATKFKKTGDPRDLAIILQHANLLNGLQKSPEDIAEEKAIQARDAQRDHEAFELRLANQEKDRIKAKQAEDDRTFRVKHAKLDSVDAIEQMFKDIK